MIPPSYLFKDIYRDRWGDPADRHGVPMRPRATGLAARIATIGRRAYAALAALRSRRPARMKARTKPSVSSTTMVGAGALSSQKLR